MTQNRQKRQMEITERFHAILNWYTSRIARFPRQARVLIGGPLQQRLFVTQDLLIERELAEWKSAIEEYLRSLYLVLHEGKTQIRPCRLGNTFLGYRVFPHTIRLDGKKGRLWIKRIKYKRRLYQAGELDWQEVKASIVSWIAHTKHADSDALIRKVLWNLVF